MLNRCLETSLSPRLILTSGVKNGARVVLREGNHLPPNVPEANLEAMYRASLDYGSYEVRESGD